MTAKRKFSWSKVVLVTSLALNLAIGGVVLGAWWNGGGAKERGRPAPAWSNGPFGRALSDEDRKALARDFRSEQGVGKKMRQHRGAMRENAQRILGALRAEPFNAEDLETYFIEMRQLNQRQIDAGTEALLDRLRSMTDQQRLEFADRFEHAIKNPPHRKRKKQN